MVYEDVVKDFAKRTKHNLAIIKALKEDEKDVYEVTQLINSMLGMLVFPKETYFTNIPKKSLEELKTEGWVIPEVEGDFPQVKDLRELIRYLRNAIVHFNIKFCDDGFNRVIGIEVWNTLPGREDPNWKAKLSIVELESITDRFLDLILVEKKDMAAIGFKQRAKRHQIKFRENVLKVGYNEFETILKDEDAQRGLIFFDGFNINEAAQDRYPHYRLNQACYANMLRSEHIPFNFFIPLSRNPEYARAVLNKFMGGVINRIAVISNEHAPEPEKALNDKTSFDVFIEYRHASGGFGILGIEVKYTEREYPLKDGSTEAISIRNPTHQYNVLTNKLNLYKKDKLEDLKTNKYRQVWRNQLLGESMTKKNHPESRYEHFTFIILYPEGNDHFRDVIPAYKNFLTPGHENSFKGITYEEFIKTAREPTGDTEYLRWLQYLEDRYIVKA